MPTLCKINKKPSIQERVTNASSIEELIKIPGFKIEFEVDPAQGESFNITTGDNKTTRNLDFLYCLGQLGVTNGGFRSQVLVFVKYQNVSTSVYLDEQPRTCANLFMYDLRLQPHLATEYLLRLVRLLAELSDYTTIRASTFSDRRDAGILQDSGYKMSEPYLNKRTNNMLADFKLIL